MRSLGIDIGGSSIKLAILENGRPAATRQSGVYSRPDANRLIEAIRQAADGQAGPFDAVGLCVPGLFDAAGRSIIRSVNVPGLEGLELDHLLTKALGTPIQRMKVANDAVATAVDIVASRGLSGRTLCLALGTGVGAAVLDDGKPLLVEGDSSGHIGQMDVSLGSNPPIGPDGGAGSLEGYIGSPALIRTYGSTEQFLKDATAGDPSLKALVRAIRICHAIYRPNHVVLAGGLGIRLSRLLSDLKQMIEADLTKIAQTGWTLSAGEHDFHAALGVARFATT